MKPVEILSAALQNSPVTLSITSTMDNRYIDVNKTFERFTGYTRGEVIGRTPSDLGTWVDYSQRVALLNRLRRERSIHGIESRFRRRVGQIWTGLSSLELIEIDQEPCAIMITADITDQKMAEAHSRISQDLIHAQEEECARVDGELRRRIDELILAYIYLDRFSQGPFDFQAETPRQLIGEVVGRLVDLSNSLYPRTLDYLGLAGAAASFCKELSVTENKKIDFCSTNVPTELPTDISLCLYRVLQEALQNAIKHSGSEQCEVLLDGRSNEIHLRIRGWGARVEKILASQGELGLVGTSERLKLVDGELLIESQPQHGTTIHVRVPTKRR